MPIPAIDTVVTPRTTLREIHADDLSDLMEVNGDPEVAQFLPYATWQSLPDASAWLERMQELMEAGSAEQAWLAGFRVAGACGIDFLGRLAC